MQHVTHTTSAATDVGSGSSSGSASFSSSGPAPESEDLTGVDRWRAVLDELDRTLSAAPGTPEYFVPLDGPLGDVVDGDLGPLPAELRPKAVELVARSEARMGEIREEMARVADEITTLGRHARSSSTRGGWWSSPGGTDRSSSGMAHEL